MKVALFLLGWLLLAALLGGAFALGGCLGYRRGWEDAEAAGEPQYHTAPHAQRRAS